MESESEHRRPPFWLIVIGIGVIALGTAATLALPFAFNSYTTIISWRLVESSI